MIHKFSTVQVFRESDDSSICANLGISGEIFPSSEYSIGSISPSVTGVGAATSYLSLADAERSALSQAKTEATSSLECSYNVNVLFTGRCPYGSDVGFVITSDEETNTDPYLAYVAAYNKATGEVPNACVSPAGPIILTNPVDITKDAGQAASMGITVYGTEPLSYQWYLNESQISGANGLIYSMTAVSSGDIGNYFVEVTNFVGSAKSSEGRLDVRDSPPVIVLQPQDLVATAGGVAEFEVVVASSSSVDYQWKKNGSNINGKISSKLTFGVVNPSDEAVYAVTVTNAFGAATSNNATLNVNTLPIIVIGPTDRNKDEGENATFAVVAEGSVPLLYQWKKNGANIGGENAASYQILNIQLSDGGTYGVEVSNSVGEVEASGVLTVSSTDVVSPVLTITHVTNSTLSNGKYYTSASGIRVLGLVSDNIGVTSMAWSDNHGSSGVPAFVAGWGTDEFSIPTGDTVFSVSATDAGGNSANGQITIHRANETAAGVAVSIIQPTELDTYTTAVSVIPVVLAASGVFDEEILSISAGNYGKGSGWFKNGGDTPYSGQINLWDGQVNTINASMWLRDGRTFVDSLDVTLSVPPPTGDAPSITTQPLDTIKNYGSTAYFFVRASPEWPPLRYQWYRNGTPINSATSQSYTTPTLTDANNDDEYRSLVSNDFGQASTSLAKLTVISAPTITKQPTDKNTLKGANVSFSVLYIGSTPMTFQWKKDGVDISGATTQTMTLLGVTDSDAADYNCVLTNASGSTTSNTGTLLVREATFAHVDYSRDMVSNVQGRHGYWAQNGHEDIKFSLDIDTGTRTISSMEMRCSRAFGQVWSSFVDYPSYPLGVTHTANPFGLLRTGFSSNLNISGNLTLFLWGDARDNFRGTKIRPSQLGGPYTMVLTIYYTSGSGDEISTLVTDG